MTDAKGPYEIIGAFNGKGGAGWSIVGPLGEEKEVYRAEHLARAIVHHRNIGYAAGRKDERERCRKIIGTIKNGELLIMILFPADIGGQDAK